MKKNFKVGFMAFGLFSASFAFADVIESTEKCVQDKKLSIEAKRACVNKCFEEEVSTGGSKMCASLSIEAEDEHLNQTYKKIMAAIQEQEVKARLVKSQKAWIALRDADCELQAAEMLGGSGEGLIYLGCVAEKTKQRTEFLKQLGFAE